MLLAIGRSHVLQNCQRNDTENPTPDESSRHMSHYVAINFVVATGFSNRCY